MPSYDDMKSYIQNVVENAYIADPNALAPVVASLGDPGNSSPYDTVQVAVVNGNPVLVMRGAAWGPPVDRTDPSAGPDPVLKDKTTIAYLVRGIADHIDAIARYAVTQTINGAPIVGGQKVYFPPMMVPGTIVGWSIIADTSGSIVIDVLNRANKAIPNGSHSIIGLGGTKPALSSEQAASSVDMDDWDTTVNVDDVFGFEVGSASGLNSVTILLDIKLSL